MEYPGCEVVDGPWSGDYADDLRKEVWNLGEIAQILRHHSLITTALYAKVDQCALAGVAQPWPSAS